MSGSDSEPKNGNDPSKEEERGTYTNANLIDGLLAALERFGYDGDVEDNGDLEEDSKRQAMLRQPIHGMAKSKKFKTKRDYREGNKAIDVLGQFSDSSLTPREWRRHRKQEFRSWVKQKVRRAEAKVMKRWQVSLNILLGKRGLEKIVNHAPTKNENPEPGNGDKLKPKKDNKPEPDKGKKSAPEKDDKPE